MAATGAAGAPRVMVGRVLGVVVALTATGDEEPRGVTATIMAATTTMAKVPVRSAATRKLEPVSTSTLVGPSSDGCRHVLS